MVINWQKITHFCFRCVSEFFVALFQNINVVACLFGIFSGSWRAVPLSMFSSGDLASSVFRRLYVVDFLFFPPGSTQVFDIKLLQNDSWGILCVFEGSPLSPFDSFGGFVSVWLLRFLFALFLVTRVSCRRTA